MTRPANEVTRARKPACTIAPADLFPAPTKRSKRVPYPHVARHLFVYERRRKTPEWVIVSAEAPQRFEIICFCDKRDADGRCLHIDTVLTAMKPWYRSRCRISAWRKATA